MAETDELLDATTALIPPLLNGLEALGYAGRHMHPPNLVSLVESVKPYREPLKNGISAFDDIVNGLDPRTYCPPIYCYLEFALYNMLHNTSRIT